MDVPWQALADAYLDSLRQMLSARIEASAVEGRYDRAEADPHLSSQELFEIFIDRAIWEVVFTSVAQSGQLFNIQFGLRTEIFCDSAECADGATNMVDVSK